MQIYPSVLQKLTAKHDFFAAHDEESPWLITFSDVISLLLVVILAWTSYQLGNHSHDNSAKKQISQQHVQPIESGYGFVQPVKAYLPHSILVEEGSVVVVLKDGRDFDRINHQLTDKGRHTVQKLASHASKGQSSVSFEIIPVPASDADDLLQPKNTTYNMRAQSVSSELKTNGVDSLQMETVF